jgi:hypothetical protein
VLARLASADFVMTRHGLICIQENAGYLLGKQAWTQSIALFLMPYRRMDLAFFEMAECDGMWPVARWLSHANRLLTSVPNRSMPQRSPVSIIHFRHVRDPFPVCLQWASGRDAAILGPSARQNGPYEIAVAAGKVTGFATTCVPPALRCCSAGGVALQAR